MADGVEEKFEMVLYHMFPTRSSRVRWLLFELGAEDNVETQFVNLMQGDHHNEDFVALNPMQAIPAMTLKDRETQQVITMTESGAICTFLTDILANGRRLRPPGDNVAGWAVYHRVISLATSSIDNLLWQIRQHETILAEQDRVPAVARRAREAYTAKVVPTVEAIINDGNGFVCSPYHDQFTTADIVLAYSLFWANMYGLNSEKMVTYLNRMKARESFQKVSAES